MIIIIIIIIKKIKKSKKKSKKKNNNNNNHKLNISVSNVYVIITFCVQNVHRSAGRYTSLQSLAAVFHCSVINGFIAEGRSDQLQYVFQLGNYFWLWLQLPALPPNVIIQWIVSTGDLRATYRWWWSRCSLTSASPLWRLTGKAERRLAGRWNHSVLQLFTIFHQFWQQKQFSR